MRFLFLHPNFFLLIGGGTDAETSTESLMEQSARAAMTVGFDGVAEQVESPTQKLPD